MPIKDPQARAEYNARYRADPAHRELARKRSADWRAANPERIAAYKENNRDEIRARGREASRAARRAHPERFRTHENRKRERHREKIRQRKIDYRRRNPEQAQAASARRKALVRQAPGNGVTLSDWREALALYGGLCPYCGRAGKLTMDHITPIVAGGEHDPTNVVAVCNRCNSSKGAFPLLIWFAKRAHDRT